MMANSVDKNPSDRKEMDAQDAEQESGDKSEIVDNVFMVGWSRCVWSNWH